LGFASGRIVGYISVLFITLVPRPKGVPCCSIRTCVSTSMLQVSRPPFPTAALADPDAAAAYLARARAPKFLRPSESVHGVEDLTVDGVRVRVYRPDD